ncbi:hypothetical protein IAG44_00950 [Streptomyces roseirectus]|uniref:Uncharacterized protein n=1 Tax=Streptomyces roseirectus TaxID=2768066 RepID=A0A7H0I5V7_9ACTN|nr:hypothetical protein [Streptomyces roseirectus]QNP68173.1 hypothetical protein IAG44_00950 [Streptomyces roseirectus]
MGDAVVERRSGSVPVQYHQFDIKDEAGPVGPELGWGEAGFVVVMDGVIVVVTGVHTGSVEVEVALYEAEPGVGDGVWEEVVEISACSVSGDLQVRGMMDDLDEELPVLAFRGAGEYRLRVHARGREDGGDLDEGYLVQVWPAPVRAVAVPRQESPGTARALR